MTPTELWDIYYHAMKKWLPKAMDREVREFVGDLMDISCKEVIRYEDKKTIIDKGVEGDEEKEPNNA